MLSICKILFIWAITINLAFAALPPAYLSVPKWKLCVGDYQAGSARFYCLPKHKPKTCPKTSYESLQKLNELTVCK